MYFDRVVGPLLMPTVRGSGLSTVAVTSLGEVLFTLGVSAVFDDSCMLPDRVPTLGSGMGSRKVTFVTFVVL